MSDLSKVSAFFFFFGGFDTSVTTCFESLSDIHVPRDLEPNLYPFREMLVIMVL